jgi:hypothetical protein
MIVVALMAVLIWGGITWYRWWRPQLVLDPFDATEMVPGWGVNRRDTVDPAEAVGHVTPSASSKKP